MMGVGTAQATHERAASVSWNAAGGNTVEFHVQSAWRRSGYTTCRNPSSPTLATMACTGPGGLPGVGDLILEDIGDTRLNFGDGSDVGSPGPGGGLAYAVSAIDVANDWLFAEAVDPSQFPALDETITHTYSSPAARTAFIQSCCRISNTVPNHHINNPDGWYRIETIVNPGGGNSPPTSSMPPIVLCPRSGLCTFSIPGADPDNDVITFRLSTDAEAAGTGGGHNFNQPGESDPSANASITTGGTYTWNTAGATLGPASDNTYYSTQVTIEDRDGSNNVKSKIAVDFLIQLVTQAGVAPTFSQPVCGSTINVNPGDPVNFTVQASDTDFGQNVTLNVAGLPLGATMTPGLPTSGNPVSSAFSWTPVAGNAGAHVVNFSAQDDAMLQAFCAVTIQVADCQSNADCSDGDACTTDTCDPGNPSATLGGCVHSAVVCDACQICDSGLGCTGAVCSPTPTATTATETPTQTPTDTPTNSPGPTNTPAPPTPVNTPSATPTPTPTTTSSTPASGCPVAPAVGCRAAAKSLLVLKNGSSDAKDKLIWKWLKGAQTNFDELPNPNDAAEYTFCLFAGAASESVSIPPGQNWRVLGTKGYKYRDLTGSPNGATKVLLRAGAQGRTKVIVKGRGANLPDTVVPELTLPVTAQLINDTNGVCFEAVYDMNDVSKNDSKRFKAKARP
jgi:hypothetical protein